jgi:hypothetical protein
MYACIYKTGSGFFEGVCIQRCNRPFVRPTPTCNAREPEPCQWGSGPKGITLRANVDGASAWGRRKPSP